MVTNISVIKQANDSTTDSFSNSFNLDYNLEGGISLKLQDSLKATPFVKWVGGKRGVITELTSRLPSQLKDYYEPFVGGGALFFELATKLNKAYLSDINIDLLITFQVIKNNPEILISQLKKHTKAHNEKYYYELRSKHHLEDPIEVAARFIYLNRTCYNGLFRTNNKGEFNVPMGRYANPLIVDEDNLLACHKALRKAIIQCNDFTQIQPSSGDFVYFDPPYHPTGENSFTKYSKSDFTEHDQVRLRDFVLSLHKKGVKIMVSNSDTLFIRNLYKSNAFHIDLIKAPRLINCKAEGRKPIQEVLIRNYV